MTRSKVQRRKDIDFSTLYYFLEARSMRSVCVVLENSKSCEILKMFLYRKIQTVRWRTEWSTSTQRVHPQIRGHRYHIPGHRTDPKINLFKSPQPWNTVWPCGEVWGEMCYTGCRRRQICGQQEKSGEVSFYSVIEMHHLLTSDCINRQITSHRNSSLPPACHATW